MKKLLIFLLLATPFFSAILIFGNFILGNFITNIGLLSPLKIAVFYMASQLINLVYYLLIIILSIAEIFRIDNFMIKRVKKFHTDYKLPILLSITPAICISFGFVPFLQDNLFYKLLFVGCIILLILLLQKKLLWQIFKILLFGSTLFFTLFYLFIMIIFMIDDYQGKYWYTFPLNDHKARYLINYDGDYWLTYYEVKENCSKLKSGENVCRDSLIKKGNTSIVESPVDLKPYSNDKPVRIMGKFVPLKYGFFRKEQKQFCINNQKKYTCQKSTGPGYWYASPLKIQSIDLE